MIRYFVDAAGNSLGGFIGEAAVASVPPGAREVPVGPDDTRQRWNGTAWIFPSKAEQIDAAVAASPVLAAILDELPGGRAAALARMKAKP